MKLVDDRPPTSCRIGAYAFHIFRLLAEKEKKNEGAAAAIETDMGPPLEALKGETRWILSMTTVVL